MMLWSLVITVILMSCKVSPRPVVTELTSDVASDEQPSSTVQDTYLRFQPKTSFHYSQTENTAQATLPYKTKDISINNNVNGTQNAHTNSGIQSKSTDGKISDVPNSRNDNSNYYSLTEDTGRENSLAVVPSSTYYDNTIASVENGESRATYKAGDGNVITSNTPQNVSDRKVYSDQDTDVVVSGDDVISRNMESKTEDRESIQGSNEPPAINNTENFVNGFMSDDGEVREVNQDTTEKEDFPGENRLVTAETETSSSNSENDDEDLELTEFGEPFDIKDLVIAIDRLIDGGKDEDRITITDTEGQTFVYSDDDLTGEGHQDSEQVYLHEQNDGIEPQKIIQKPINEEKTYKNDQQYPILHVMLDFNQDQGNEVVNLEDLSETFISDVESFARPLLEVAQDFLPQGEIGASSNDEQEPSYGINLESTVGTEENNEKSDERVNTPFHTFNEIAIIY